MRTAQQNFRNIIKDIWKCIHKQYWTFSVNFFPKKTMRLNCSLQIRGPSELTHIFTDIFWPKYWPLFISYVLNDQIYEDCNDLLRRVVFIWRNKTLSMCLKLLRFSENFLHGQLFHLAITNWLQMEYYSALQKMNAFVSLFLHQFFSLHQFCLM